MSDPELSKGVAAVLQSRFIHEWDVLAVRLGEREALREWAGREPALLAAARVEDLRALTAPGGDRGAADVVLGALVRIAAIDGGDDCDAVLVVTHLLADGVRRLARMLSDLGGDVMPVIIGELACQIRAFPWRRRTHAYAANLLLDTRAAVLVELLAAGRGHRSGVAVYPCDPGQWQWQSAGPLPDPRAAIGELRAVPAAGVNDDVDLVDLLMWAVTHGVASRADLALLVDLERNKVDGSGSRWEVAAAWGINERTLRRRRDKTLAALRAAAPRYLAAVA